MADHGPIPDPIDKAYAQAEAMLSDDAERVARRGRVLAAVAQEKTQSRSPVAVSPRNSSRRVGGWLVAASVVGFGVFVALQIPRWPSRSEPPPPPRVAPAPTAAALKQAAVQPPPASIAPPRPSLLEPPRETESARAATPPAPPAVVPPNIPAPPPLFTKPVEAPRPAPPPPPVAEAPAAAQKSLEGDYTAGTRTSPDLAGRLRDAAAAGRAGEVQDLLDQGAPVDAADSDGDTALMKSIKSDRPAAAATLRQNGASLDRRNHAGESARDMAETANDPALKQALELTPP